MPEMGQIRLPPKAKLFCAICYAKDYALKQATKLLIEKFGDIANASEVFDFSYTDYYAQEMGSQLFKRFYAFAKKIDPESLVEIKLETNAIENKLSESGKRTVNLDPGYLEAAKLVLATTKNFSHRIYLGKGIYGDVQLYYRNGRFQTNAWTYPDYKDEKAILFFKKMRTEYLLNLKQHIV